MSRVRLPRHVRSAFKRWHPVVTRNVILLGAALAVGGVALLHIALGMTGESEKTKELLKELATTLFSLGVLACVWELFARRAFMREVLDSVELADEVAEAGLRQICWQYNQDIPWQNLFRRSSEVCLFFSYAQTWRNNNFAHIEEFAATAGKLRVVLPDPDDGPTMQELSRRFAYAPDKLPALIKEAIAAYAALAARFPGGIEVQIRVVSVCPLHAIYLFSESAVVSLHSHQKRRVSVPTMLVDAKKPVYNFLKDEFECVFEQGRQVHPIPSPPQLAEHPAHVNDPPIPAPMGNGHPV